ncbi:restriction system protein [Marinomonas balearica]|uniref:Restriction system protein n=1 Tax=Marinomonas balearica TaxID=491947 RepID=A0A4R6MDI1_9GAMM|nr:restriction system protein [Marinomonas balearica]
MKVWGIHMSEEVGSSPLDNHYVAIGWDKLGDLKHYAGSREQLKDALQDTYPDIKKGAIAGNAGVLFRFVNSIQRNDIVVYPSKMDRMVNIGRVISDYGYVVNDQYGYPNQRRIEWLGSFPRSDFSQSALYEIGAFITLFSIKRHAAEFLNKVNLATPLETIANPDDVDDDASDVTSDDDLATESISQQAVQTTEDFIIKQLHSKLTGYEFEYFVAHILECMGYKARVSSKSGDGGVDVIAHKDELGFEPPIIKVQCKKSTGQNGEPDANQLLGALGEGEYGLFVNLGSYSRPARLLERNKAKLRLIDGDELVDLVLEHYPKLSHKYRALLPLKQIYVANLN